MIVHSYHFLVAPLVTLGALGVIILLCRWVFSPPARTSRRGAPSATGKGLSSRRADYGLLVPIASVRTLDDAEMLRAVLVGAGVRCTVVQDRQGADVLVFRTDAVRARELVS